QRGTVQLPGAAQRRHTQGDRHQRRLPGREHLRDAGLHQYRACPVRHAVQGSVRAEVQHEPADQLDEVDCGRGGLQRVSLHPRCDLSAGELSHPGSGRFAEPPAVSTPGRGVRHLLHERRAVQRAGGQPAATGMAWIERDHGSHDVELHRRQRQHRSVQLFLRARPAVERLRL
ncbi:hypothetical protein OY671_010663, partial [Metschnikowia pulcherrima]